MQTYYKSLIMLPVLAPLIAAIAWITTLLLLLILWLTHGQQRYEQTSPHISFISNIGAFYKTAFVAGAAVTSFFFVTTLILFIFRHKKLQTLCQGTKQRLFFDI